MKHLEWKLLGAALLLAIIFDVLFYKTEGLGLNVFLMQIAILGVSIGLAKYRKHSIPAGTWVAGSFALLYSITFVIWTSAIGTAMSFLGLIVSNIIFASYLLGHHGKFHHPLHAIADGFRYTAETFFTKISILGRLKFHSLSIRNSSVVRGILITIPIVLMFLALFLGSDLILQQRAQGITHWLDTFLSSGDVIAHVFIIGFWTILFLVFFAAAFWKRMTFDDLKHLVIKHNIESAIVLVSVNLLFLAFIIFQAVYLFGGQSAWENIEGITYSEYAVQGFNELATVAILVVFLILSLRYFHTEKTQRKLIHAFELVLIGQTLLIVFSAWKRMALYVAQYDFTPARLFGFWFFILAAAILLLLAYHIARKIPQYKFIQQGLILTGIATLLFTMSAPDALSVRLNTARAENNQLDPFPLFNDLSAEAYLVMNNVLKSGDYDTGLLDTTITDYCPFVRAHYNDSKIVSFTLIPDSNIREDLREDFELRREIARFDNKWSRKATQHDWRSWNLSRSNLQEQEHIDDRGIPFPADKVAEACGMRVGDQKQVSEVNPEDRR